MPETETYTIRLGGEWLLEDLYQFPRTFEQVYFAVYSLDPTLEEIEADKITRIYRAFPWQGGYSAVNFYNDLKYLTPKRQRPKVISIEYSSPGSMELALFVLIALQVENIVKSACKSMTHINKLYGDIVKGMQQRELMRLKIQIQQVKLKKEEAEFIEKSAKAMSRALGFSNVAELNKRTGHPYITLKILLSLFRRVRVLAEYQNKGKATLDTEEGV
jgi:hypothetical protein